MNLEPAYRFGPENAKGSAQPCLMPGIPMPRPRTAHYLRDALVHYVEHQREVVRRRSEYRLAQRRKRAHVLEGRLRALVNGAELGALAGAEDAVAAEA